MLSLPAERFSFRDDGVGITVLKQIISRCVTKRGRTGVVSWSVMGLIRFRGHFPKGGYDVHTDGRHFQEATPASPIR